MSNYAVARVVKYTQAGVGKAERHIERKNLNYENMNVDLSQTPRNVHFKRCEDPTYSQHLDRLVEEGTVSLRGLKQDAKVFDEMIFDVNTAYFEEHGGYDYAIKFYWEVYRFAQKEYGPENIVSAVMHADELNTAVSEQLGYPVYHYHLHVVALPVVEKEIRYSKRCKDPELVGKVKEVIHQISHSKKWASQKVTDEEGKTHLIKSYSLLQDRFFEHMRDAGFEDFERGERGSTAQHLSVTEYKVQQEQKRLDAITEAKIIAVESLNQLGAEEIQKQEELVKLEKQAEKAQDRLDSVVPVVQDAVKFAQDHISYFEDLIPEAGPLESAKSFREKKIMPLISKLKDKFLGLYRRIIDLQKQMEKLQRRLSRAERDRDYYKGQLDKEKEKSAELSEDAKDLMRVICDESGLRRKIYDAINPYVTTGLAKKVDSLLELLRVEAYTRDLPVQTDRIHVANGTLFLDGTFSEEKEYCRNRLPVAYDPDAAFPERWLQFLNVLLIPEDILTLQEYLGYCLIPTTKAQKMLMLVGKGGEGKSRIGVVMRALFGNSMVNGNLTKVETNRFARADLEHTLVMVDDDMKLEALPQTNYIKTIITAELPLDLEKKSQQSYQGELYCRFLGFGNGSLKALYDRSDGFFRRQIILTTRRRERDRIDDPYLSEKLTDEKEGIFLWCLEGLNRLIAQDYRFTISQRTKENMEEAVQEGNHIVEFMASEGYIRLKADYEVSTKDLYSVYRLWCEDNSVKPYAQNSFSAYLKENSDTYNLEPTNNIYNSRHKRVRGFVGIELLERPDAFPGSSFYKDD